MNKIYSRLILLMILSSFCFNMKAQLPDGSIAPDFTVTDINGVEHNLYSILDEGKTVILDIFATWCGPCWTYHQGHTLENAYNAFGPNGTDELVVLAIEADGNTDPGCLYGSGSCNATTIGNWTTGISYPIIDDPSINNLYNIFFFPTIYIVYPNRIVNQLGQQSLSVVEDALDDYEKAGTGLAPKVIRYSGFQGSLCNDLWPVAPGYLLSNYGDVTIESCDIKVRKDDEVIFEEVWSGSAETYHVMKSLNLPTQILTENTKFTFSVENINGNADDQYEFVTGVTLSTNNLIRVSVETDENAVVDNNRYEILDENGNVIISESLNQNNTLIEKEHYLDAIGCYNFNILDDGGNGINGTVNVTDGQGNIIYSNVNSFAEGDGRRFNVSLVSSNTNVLEDVSVSISPNPVFDRASVSIQSLEQNDFVLTVLNGFGQEVHRMNVASGDYQGQLINLDVSDFSAGVYFMNIRNEHGILTKKFMVQK